MEAACSASDRDRQALQDSEGNAHGRRKKTLLPDVDLFSSDLSETNSYGRQTPFKALQKARPLQINNCLGGCNRDGMSGMIFFLSHALQHVFRYFFALINIGESKMGAKMVELSSLALSTQVKTQRD